MKMLKNLMKFSSALAAFSLKFLSTEMTYEAHTLICTNGIYMLLAERAGRPFRAVGSDCILRRVGEWPHERRHVRNSVGAATSAGKILLPTNEYWRSGGLDNLFEPKCITGLGCGKVARPVLLFER